MDTPPRDSSDTGTVEPRSRTARARTDTDTGTDTHTDTDTDTDRSTRRGRGSGSNKDTQPGSRPTARSRCLHAAGTRSTAGQTDTGTPRPREARRPLWGPLARQPWAPGAR